MERTASPSDIHIIALTNLLSEISLWVKSVFEINANIHRQIKFFNIQQLQIWFDYPEWLFMPC